MLSIGICNALFNLSNETEWKSVLVANEDEKKGVANKN